MTAKYYCYRYSSDSADIRRIATSNEAYESCPPGDKVLVLESNLSERAAKAQECLPVVETADPIIVDTVPSALVINKPKRRHK